MKPAVKDDLVKGWTCPCGCALQLGSKDVANERRLIALLGPTPRAVTLRSDIAPARVRKDPPEPTAKGTCRNCGATMEIFEYLAAALKLRGAPWPYCDSCMQKQQRAA